MEEHAKIPGLSSLIPSLGWLQAYRKEWLRPDAIAGLTTASVVIPKAMAYAAIAGLPVQIGLYTVFIPMVIYAFFGTSRPLSMSTTTTIAILTATELATLSPNGTADEYLAAAATLALLVGAMLVLAAVLRLGFIANFISDPVLTGFKTGIGLVIVVDQVPKLLGQHFDKGGFLHNIISVVRDLPDVSVPTLGLSLVMLALIFGMERFRPHSPAPLLAVIVGIAASALMGLEGRGVSIAGDIPSGLPAFTVPDLTLAGRLWPGALGIALMSFVETIAAGRAFLKHGEDHPEPNRELFALGLANAAGSLFQTMPAGGGTSQTAVNRNAGALTQAAAIVTAAMAVASMLFLAPIIGLMPQATLASVVVATSIGLVSPAEFLTIRRIRHIEFRWALVALVGVLFLGTLKGILVAVIVSMLALLHQANNPPVYAMGRIPGRNAFRPRSAKHPKDETFEGLLMLRTEGRMHFASAPQAGQKMRALVQEYNPKVVVLDLSAVPDIEYTALRMLTEAEENMRKAGITLWLSALNPEALKVIRQAPLGEILGRDRMFYTLKQAMEKYQTIVR